MTPSIKGGWRAGWRVGAGLAAGSFLLAVSFGAYAVTHGWPVALTIALSLLVFSGSAQFALVTALAGGGLPAALTSAALINLRFVPMAAATARHLRGGRWRRAVEGQAVVDGSWAAAQRPDGGFDRRVLIGATLVQWPAWVCGTAIGTLAVPDTSLIRAWGIDIVFPGFFVVLLVDSLTARPRLVPVTLAAAAVAGTAARFLPVGVALLLAATAVLLALLGQRNAAGTPRSTAAEQIA